MGFLHSHQLGGRDLGSEPLLGPPPHVFDHPGFEYRYGVSYAAKHDGFLPHDQFWMYEKYLHDVNPKGFDRHHHRLAPLLDRDAAMRHARDKQCPPTGLLPQDPYWDYLRYRHDLNPHRFDHNSPKLGKLLDEDEAYRLTHPCQCISSPSNATPPTRMEVSGFSISPAPDSSDQPAPHLAPEPGAVFLLALGLLSAGSLRIWRRRRPCADLAVRA